MVNCSAGEDLGELERNSLLEFARSSGDLDYRRLAEEVLLSKAAQDAPPLQHFLLQVSDRCMIPPDLDSTNTRHDKAKGAHR